MTYVLLVDDEPSVLSGLRRMLSRQRRDWVLLVADSGHSAIAALEANAVDAIVSDCRMPGMDGPTLLAYAREHYPAVARIMLSGQLTNAAEIEALEPVQQFLAKPCDPAQLCQAIDRAIDARRALASTDALALVSGVQSLATPPTTLRNVTAMLSASDVSIAEVAEVVSRDIALSAKLLQLVNSAFFSLAHTVSSVTEATNYLGIDVVRGLAASLGVFKEFRELHGDTTVLEQLELHSTVVAAHAARFAPASQRGSVFTAAMLHDVGWLVIAVKQPAELDAYCARPVDTHSLGAEEDAFGAHHPALGGALLTLWGIPEDIVAVVARHHDAGAANGHPLLDAVIDSESGPESGATAFAGEPAASATHRAGQP